ncbi:hypothetical protein C6A86_027555 [Mycobacterium sp. ITM-2016-00316]|uniref:hypothetical protein n=1 Tax=Mycobacterium sp. ITM-2016-00316 TaxID=2099695 RepID=UPI000CF9E246|nr:hypothetical protein [Mycobacterium sp. ITM-2016-00316]WNG81858.1 hypothetical protein C6A86_027555 [Mycobacterium sp. ITM-2016-00316]
MKFAGLRLRQRDGISCGPSVAVLAAALLKPDYGTPLGGAAAASWFDAEQVRVHHAVNRIWPRRLGMTPRGLAGAIGEHSPVRYRWRLCLGLLRRTDPLDDVVAAIRDGFPVAMLVGRFIPRHWVLIVGVEPGTDVPAGDGQLRCYEPSSGRTRVVDVAAVRRAELNGLGFPRPFAFVLPVPGRPRPRCAT